MKTRLLIVFAVILLETQEGVIGDSQLMNVNSHLYCGEMGQMPATPTPAAPADP